MEIINANKKSIVAFSLMLAMALAAFTPTFAHAAYKPSSYIGTEKAISIALADAGFSKSEVTVEKSNNYDKEGIRLYDIEFLTSTTKYSYEINAVTGAVIAVYRKGLYTNKQTSAGNSSASNSSGSNSSGANGNSASPSSCIAADEAKNIAYAHANVSPASVKKVDVKPDKDHGVQFYKVEFKTSSMKYEYEINAANGTVIEYESKKD
jgi:uncharacterized membrane protein YkoI